MLRSSSADEAATALAKGEVRTSAGHTEPQPRPVAFSLAAGMPARMPAKKVAYEYNISAVLSVLLSYKGTFWPLVLRTPELYFYPLLHTALVLGQFSWQQQADDGIVDRGVFWQTVFEYTANDDGVNIGPKVSQPGP